MFFKEMKSYITKAGNLVYHYCPYADDYEAKEREAILKHGLDGARITTIAVTRKTDFLKREAV